MADNNFPTNEQMEKIYAICLEPIPLADSLNPDEVVQVDFFLDKWHKMNNIIIDINQYEYLNAIESHKQMQNDLNKIKNEFELITSVIAKTGAGYGTELSNAQNKMAAVKNGLNDAITFLEKFSSMCIETGNQINAFTEQLRSSLVEFKSDETNQSNIDSNETVFEKSGFDRNDGIFSSTNAATSIEVNNDQRNEKNSGKLNQDAAEEMVIEDGETVAQNTEVNIDTVAAPAVNETEEISDKENVAPNRIVATVRADQLENKLLHRFVCKYCAKSFKSTAQWHKHQVRKHACKIPLNGKSNSLAIALPSILKPRRKRLSKHKAYFLYPNTEALPWIVSAKQPKKRHI